jgi:hypothetical protein
MPKKGFELVPSQLIIGCIFVIPKDEYSTQHAIAALAKFNHQYPDTHHTKEARQNHVIRSVPRSTKLLSS